MKTGRGGHWNRAGRKSGGSRPLIVGASRQTSDYTTWQLSVRAFYAIEALKTDLFSVVTEDELKAWFDAGERSSWAALQAIDRAKTRKSP